MNLGFTSSSNISGLTVSGPAGDFTTPYVTALGTWTSSVGSLSNSGCGGNNGAFVCAMSTVNGGYGAEIIQGGSYTWTWNYNYINPSLISSEVHIGTNYDGTNGLIVSQTASVPEASTMSMLLLGLIGLGFVATTRRRFAPCQT